MLLGDYVEVELHGVEGRVVVEEMANDVWFWRCSIEGWLSVGGWRLE